MPLGHDPEREIEFDPIASAINLSEVISSLADNGKLEDLSEAIVRCLDLRLSDDATRQRNALANLRDTICEMAEENGFLLEY